MSKTYSKFIELLVQLKFPGASTHELLADQKVAALQVGIRAELDPAVVQLTREAEKYRSKLRKMTPKRLENLYAKEKERQWQTQERQNRKRVARFSNADDFTVVEAAWLLTGRDPVFWGEYDLCWRRGPITSSAATQLGFSTHC